MKTYTIGNKVFVLKKLVLCQTRALFEEFSKGNLSFETNESLLHKISNFTGKDMPRILACILLEENKNFPKEVEDFENIVSYIDNNISLEQVIQVMQDFLVLNPPEQMSSPSLEKDSVSLKTVGVS